jgi:hypothetical protein
MRTIFGVPIILVACVGVVAFATGAGRAEPATTQQTAGKAAADDCAAKPGATAPQGSHWYYRIERASGRHCWYLGPVGAKVHARETPARVSSPKPPAAETPAPRLADETAPAGAEPPWPPAAVQLAPAGAAERVPETPLPGAPTPAPQAAPNAGLQSSAVVDAAEEGQDEMPLVWPVLGSSEGSAPAPTAQANVRWEYVLATIAGALALAAVLVSAIFKQSVPPAPAHMRPSAQRYAAPGLRAERATDSPPSMYLPPRHRPTAMPQAVRSSRRDEPASPRPATRASDAGGDLEASLQQLLQAWQRAAA